MELARRSAVPAGYHFAPTPEELIRGYLNPWVTGHTAAFFPGIVCVADIYALDPDALTSRFRHAGHGGNWYFLCVARWKGGKAGTRMSRCVHGGGTWHCSSKRKPVGANDGYRQGFEYRDAGGKKTAWIMDEFATSLEQATDGQGVRVICKVHRSSRAAPTTPAEEGEEETTCSELQAGPSMRPRLLLYGEEHGLAAACSPPAETRWCYSYNAGTSHQPAASVVTWQQSVTEQGTGRRRRAGDGGEQEESAGGTDQWLERIDFGFDTTDHADADADALLNEWTDFSSYDDSTGGLKAAGGGHPSTTTQD